jgi:hypothetical protein
MSGIKKYDESSFINQDPVFADPDISNNPVFIGNKKG